MSEEVKKKKKRKKYKKRKVKKEPNKRVYNKHTHQIVLLNHNKQVEFIGSYSTETKANKAFNELMKQNEKVVFPIRYNNCLMSGYGLKESNYELAIIQRREKDDPKVTTIRNEVGDFIEQTTNHENWVVYEKKKYEKEESFWVYGYHPLIQRKDFIFIYEQLVKPKAINKGEMLNVMLFKNKVLFETLNGDMDMVICKNKSDGIRLYNQLEEWCEKDKQVKYFLFSGDWSKSLERMVSKIQKLTNWDERKIRRSSTRP